MLTLTNKQDKIAGLEIADALVTPIARKILGRDSKINTDIIEAKMRQDNLCRPPLNMFR